LLLIVVAVVFILLVPLIAMQFTEEVKWHTNDFIIAGALLLGAGLLYELIIRKVKKTNYRLIAFLLILLLLVLTWLELAVGIFNSPWAGS